MTTRKPAKARHTTKPKRSAASKAARRRGSSVASLQYQTERQVLTEALEQQTATAEVLRIIANSPTDAQPIFDAIVSSAVRICDARFGAVFRLDDRGLLHLVSHYNFEGEQLALLQDTYPMQPSAEHISGRAILAGTAVQIPDLLADDNYRSTQGRKAGFRSLLAAPMLRGGRPVGAIVIYRLEPGAFAARQLAMLQTFADSAVIAIENARLFEEVRESLDQLTATSEVLKVISASPGDLQPVFQAILQNAVRICDASFGTLPLYEGDAFRIVAMHNAPRRYDELRRREPVIRPAALMRVAATKQLLHITDVTLFEGEDPDSVAFNRLTGARSLVVVPMLKENELIGAITIYRREIRPFTDKQIELVQNFAAQAVIAIEKARLLNELRQRTDELARSVEELRALGEVSQAVNSTLDLQTVLSTIVAKAVQLAGTEAGAIYVFDDADRQFRLRATYGMDRELIEAVTNLRIGLDDVNIAHVVAQREPHQTADLRLEASIALNKITLAAGYRARLTAPLFRGDQIVGLLVVRRRTPGAFPQNTLELMKTFAAQSVLAIENARLFSENEKTLARLSKELDAARALQLGMLPHELPKHSPDQPIEMHAFIEPAREVGGDLYDCFYVADHLCCFLVGDVAGKGAPAAMFMARTSSLVRMAVTFWRQAGSDITARKLVESVNRELCQNNDEDMFVTAFVGLLDTQFGTVDYVNAGHPAPYILRASGGVAPIEGKSDLPLGLQNTAVFHSHSLTLQPGDMIFAYSDGIIEAANESELLYGQGRLRAELSAAGSTAMPAELVRAVIKSAQTFAGTAPKSDDVTALALRWLPVDI